LRTIKNGCQKICSMNWQEKIKIMNTANICLISLKVRSQLKSEVMYIPKCTLIRSKMCIQEGSTINY
jgi:hypothetical protein